MKKCIIFLSVYLFISSSVGHKGHHHEPEEPEAKTEENGEWANSRNITLKKMTGVVLKWVDTDHEWVKMEMRSSTTGYVAVGFCSEWHGTMEGCDIVLGWVDDNATVYLRDYHAIGNQMIIEDKVQNYEVISGTETDGVTTIRFQRKWSTGDETEDVDLHKSVRIIYAWHPQDPLDYTNIPHHDKNGRGHNMESISMRNPMAEINEAENNQFSSNGGAPMASYTVPFLLFSVIRQFV